MARIRMTSTAASTIPTPPTGKSTIFLDSADLSFKAKLSDGSFIPISTTVEFIQDTFADFLQDSSTVNFISDDAGNTASLEVIQTALDVFLIPVTPSGNLTSDNVGDALNELQSSIDSSGASFADHIDGGPSKHDATEIDYELVDGSKIDIQTSSDNLETAVKDLDDNKLSVNGNNTMQTDLDIGGNSVSNVSLVDGRDVSVDGTKLDTIETGAKDDQTASEVTVVPSGNLVSNNVQSALQELQGDFDGLSSVASSGDHSDLTLDDGTNPHSTTKADVGLGSVNNTSDENKPISTQTQTALDNKQPLDSDLTAISNLIGSGIITRTATGTAVVRSILGTSSNIVVVNGDGVSGNPTIDLPNLGSTSTVGSASQTITLTTDTKGRISSKVAQAINITSSQISNFATTVRSTVLTGYSTGASAAIVATDSILNAFGKAQGQINSLFSRNINTGTGLQGGGDLTADRTLSLTDTGVVAGTYGSTSKLVTVAINSKGRITSVVEVSNRKQAVAAGVNIGSASSAANQNFQINLSSFNHEVGDTIRLGNSYVRGDFDNDGTEFISVGIGSTGAAKTDLGVNGYKDSSIFATDGSTIDQTYTVVDIGSGVPGLQIFISPSSTVNADVGLPNGWWWQFKVDILIGL